jgi:hypothetical protein
MRSLPLVIVALVVLRPTDAAAAAAPHPLASFRETARAPVGQTPVALAVGELSGDGHADVMVVNAESTATLLLGDGAGAGTQRDRVRGDVLALAARRPRRRRQARRGGPPRPAGTVFTLRRERGTDRVR